MKEADRFATDDITWCMAECETDCPRQPRYIRDKTIPHSFADFSKGCMAYLPKDDDPTETGWIQRCPKCGKRGYIRSLESMGVKLKESDEYRWKCTNCNRYFKEEPKDEPQTEREGE